MKNSPGVYEIKNKKNGDRYVGSSISVAKRWKQHISMLKKGSHHCIRLQNAWNKYGEESFYFEVIEWCEKENLIDREQYHMDLGYKYNSSPSAQNALGVKHSEETKEKHRKRGKIRVKKDPEFLEALRNFARRKKTKEWKERIGAAHRGVKKSEKQVIRMAIARAEMTEIQVSEIINLRRKGMSIREICKETMRNYSQVRRVCSGDGYKWAKDRITQEESKKLLAYQYGHKSPRACKKIYVFSHPDHGDIECTQIDFRSKFPEINPKLISGICCKTKKSTHGWSIKKWPD